MSTDLDDLIRTSLNSEADELAADPETEAAWQRLDDAAESTHRSFRRPFLTIISVAAAAAAVVALVNRPDDSSVQIETPVTEPTTTAPATTETTDTTAKPPVVAPLGPGVFPGTDFVAVREDGALVRVTVAGGAELELARFGDPTSLAEPAIQNVSLDPEGNNAYFEVSGGSDGTSQIYAVRTDGASPPAALIEGREPVVDQSGNLLAFLDGDGLLKVMNLDTEAVIAPSTEATDFDLTWLMDGRLAAAHSEGEASANTIVTYGVSATEITQDEVYTPPDGVSYRHPQASALGTLYAVSPDQAEPGPTQGEIVVVDGTQRFPFPKPIRSLSGGLGASFIVTWDDGTVSRLDLTPDNQISETPIATEGRYNDATW